MSRASRTAVTRDATLLAGLALTALLAPAPALAVDPPELLAEQLAIDPASNTGVGDAIGQEFAQGFEVARAGYLGHVLLPLNCLTWPTPTLHVTVQALDKFDRPDGRVLASQTLPGHVMDAYPARPNPPGLRMVMFRRPPLLRPGRYAFTVSASGGMCQLWYGPPGNPYAGGDTWLSTRPGAAPAATTADDHTAITDAPVDEEKK